MTVPNVCVGAKVEALLIPTSVMTICIYQKADSIVLTRYGKGILRSSICIMLTLNVLGM